MRILCLSTLFSLLFISSFGQQFSVSGAIVSNKQPLPGAVVRLDNTTYVAAADSNGNFKIDNLPSGSYNLVITFLGFSNLTKNFKVLSAPVNLGKLEMKSSEKELSEVNVSGQLKRGSEGKAISLTKNAKQIVTVVSSEGMKKLPDKNAADALKRVAGVAVTNNKGEGGYVSLRGTPTDWTSTLINGDRLPVADEENTSRSFEFEVLPSELIDNIFVTRTSTPDLEGDNVGGTINFFLKGVPDKRTLKANIGGGYNSLARKPIMSANFLYGDVSKNKKVSYLLNTTYLGRYYGVDATKTIYGNNFNHAINRYELRDYQGMRNTFGFNGAIEFKLKENIKFGVRAMTGYMNDDKWQNRLAYTYTSGDNSTIKPQFVHGELIRELYGGDIYADIKVNEKWKLNVKYSSYYNRFRYGNFPYKNKDPRNGYVVLEFTATKPITYLDIDPILTDGSAYDPNAPVDPNNQLWSYVKLLDIDNPYGKGDRYDKIKPQVNTEYNDSTLEFLRAFSETNNTWEWDPGVVQLDAEHKLKENIMLRFGVKGRYKTGSRELGYHEWRVDRRGGRDTKSYILAEFETEPNRYDDYMKQWGSPYSDQKLPYMTRNQFRNFFTDMENRSKGPLQDYYMNEQNSEYRFWVGSSYNYQEIQAAGYILTDVKIKKLNIIAGIRYEHTYMQQKAYDLGEEKFDTATNTYFYPSVEATTKLNYPAILPSINFNYFINDKMALKWALSRTYHRQNFQETKPGAALIKYTDFLYVLGNPNLKPAFSYNGDVVYEYYWGNKGMFSIGGYGKYVVDHIFMTNSGGSDPRENFIVKSYDNANNSWVVGVELDIKRRFDFLPKFLSGFGLNGNVTYSYSGMSVPGRPKAQAMAEQAPLLYNVGIFYEKYGVNARVALNYTSAFLQELNLASVPGQEGKLLHTNSDFDIFMGEYYSMDAQISYEFKKYFTIGLELNNLLNWQYKEYRGNPNRPIRVEYYRQRGQLTFTYQF
jgi:TonB-dependent receptor